jgi:hypothetical protein
MGDRLLLTAETLFATGKLRGRPVLNGQPVYSRELPLIVADEYEAGGERVGRDKQIHVPDWLPAPLECRTDFVCAGEMPLVTGPSPSARGLKGWNPFQMHLPDAS